MNAQTNSPTVVPNVVIAQPPPKKTEPADEQFDIFDMSPQQNDNSLDMLLQTAESENQIANQQPQDYYLGSLNWGSLE